MGWDTRFTLTPRVALLDGLSTAGPQANTIVETVDTWIADTLARV